MLTRPEVDEAKAEANSHEANANSYEAEANSYEAGAKIPLIFSAKFYILTRFSPRT